jgi:hypothetical protein
MAGSDFSCPCIIGDGSSPSQCGSAREGRSGRTRELPASDAIPSHVFSETNAALGGLRLQWDLENLPWRSPIARKCGGLIISDAQIRFPGVVGTVFNFPRLLSPGIGCRCRRPGLWPRQFFSRCNTARGQRPGRMFLTLRSPAYQRAERRCRCGRNNIGGGFQHRQPLARCWVLVRK